MRQDFSKWKIFFCDERVVPEDSIDSTYGTVKRGLLIKNTFKDEQFVRIKSGLNGKKTSYYKLKYIPTLFLFLSQHLKLQQNIQSKWSSIKKKCSA